MSVSKIYSQTNVYQRSDNQSGAGQLRNGFRRLLQSIQDGNLPAAQQAYDTFTQTFPKAFQALSDTLTKDYKAIGQSLAKGDISGARQAVVKLQQDLQSIGRDGTPPQTSQNRDNARNTAVTAGTNTGVYNEQGELVTVGANIDIKI